MESAAQRLAQISARIFGQTLNPTAARNGLKYLRQRPKGDAILRWYPPMAEQMHKIVRWQRSVGLFVDDFEDRRLEKNARLRMRGKGPPKKGEGKRAGLKKK